MALRAPAVEPLGEARDFTWITTELCRRTGLLERYNAALNRGAALVPLKGEGYDFSLATDQAHSVETIWNAVCQAATAALSEGKEVHDLDWFKQHGHYVVPFDREDWFLTPTMVRQGLRYELPYQERLLRVGAELGRRLHEHDIHWWDSQLSEYVAIPEWHDVPERWVESIRSMGADPADYPLWGITTKVMPYTTGNNAGIPLMHEVSANLRNHGAVVINATTAAGLGIANGDWVEVRSPIGATQGRAAVGAGLPAGHGGDPRPVRPLEDAVRQGPSLPLAQHRGAAVAGTDRRHRLGRRCRPRLGAQDRRPGAGRCGMTRYVMVADLRRCVGCQTCTAACKEGNGTPPGVQWRRVLDLETGTYPNVNRVFVPVGCQHCANPPCMEVCPSTATGQRADGIVTIDYDLCIGCSYCAMACPYDARSMVDHAEYAFGDTPTAAEAARASAGADRRRHQMHLLRRAHRRRHRARTGPRPGPRGDAALRQFLHLRRAAFRRHRGQGRADRHPAGGKPVVPHARERGHRTRLLLHLGQGHAMSQTVTSRRQRSWDLRAAGNFIGGGTGAGLIVIAAIAAATARHSAWRSRSASAVSPPGCRWCGWRSASPGARSTCSSMPARLG